MENLKNVNSDADAEIYQSNKDEVVNEAWTEKRYDEVLSLLEKDSLFPRNFNIDELVHEGNQKLLKEFVMERLNLHDCIKKGDLNKVKQLTVRKSKWYFNLEDQSAAFTAIKCKKFHIYAYLKSIGAGLDHHEKYGMDRLNMAEKNNLRETVHAVMRRNPEDLILNLKSKSKSINPPEEFSSLIEKYYEDLNKNISSILRVVECEYDLEIIYDFDDDGVFFLNHAHGLTLFQQKTIYIGCKRKRNEILGTLAHELTHMVMDIVFENNGKPYENQNKDDQKEFDEITQSIKKRIIDNNSPEAKIISAVFKYDEQDHHKELIVRIPHIIAEFEKGNEWLQKNVSELCQYYQQKVLPKCKNIISQRHLIKAKRMNSWINENKGEIGKIKKRNLFFQNVDSLKLFLKKQKISFLITDKPRLGLFRVLQALYDKNYINHYDNFMVLKFKKLVSELTEIKVAFFSSVTDSLIVDCKRADQESLESLLATIEGWKKNKKVVFVVEKNQYQIVEKFVKENSVRGMKCDDEFSSNDLDPESKEAILKKKITFQETEMTLGEFCEKKEYFDLITGDVIEKLLGKETCRIGGKIFGISSLEGSYAQIIQEINIASLCSDLKASRDVFIICGEKDKAIESLDLDNVADQIDVIDVEKYLITYKNILFPAENFDFDFKKFCENNPLKKVYLINMNGKNLFVLEQIYNPDFYMERKIKKVVMKSDAEKMVKDNSKEFFVITGKNNLTENLLKEPNVQELEADEAEKYLTESKDATHWFQAKDDVIIWEKSSGSITNIRRCVEEKLCKENLISENDLIKEISGTKVVIIADEPGMGKSTTITKLYESKSVAKKHWIIRINLKDNLNVIRQISFKDLTTRKIIDILLKFESKSDNELNKFFLELILNPGKTFPKYLLLTFDGFDELLDKADRENTIGLLKYLKNETKCKIWITSRLHFKSTLEDELGTFSLQFHPIDNTTKKEFILKYYKDRLNLILNEETFRKTFNSDGEETKLWKYVQELISKSGNIFQGNVSTVLGTPLQLNLMLDNSVDYFKNWVEGTVKNLNFFYLGDNCFEVYQNYISRKYDIYFKKTNITEKPLQNIIKSGLEKCHKNLTLYFINNEISSKEYERHAVLLLLIGLIRMEDKNVQFFHFTFREFYCAQILIEYLTGKIYEPPKVIEEMEILFQEVLAEPEYALIRKFIDNQLQNEEVRNAAWENLKLISDKFPSYKLLSKNLNNFNSEISEQNGFFEPGKNLHNSILENNANLFALLFSNLERYCKPYEILKLKDYPWNNLLESAAVSGNLEIWKILVAKMEDISVINRKILLETRSIYNNSSLFHVSAKMYHYEVLKLLLELLEKDKLFSPEHKIGFLMRTDSRFDTTLLSICRLERNNFNMIKLMVEKSERLLSIDDAKKLFTYKNPNNENCLFLASQHSSIEIIELLLDEAHTLLSLKERSDFLMTQNTEKGNVLLTAVERNNSAMVKLLLEKADTWLDEKRRKLFLTKRNYLHENVLLLAVRQNNNEIIKLILEKIKCLSPQQQRNLYTAKNFSKENVLLLAVERSNIEITRLLLKASKMLSPYNLRRKFFLIQNDQGENVLVLAVKNKNEEMINLLVKEAKRLLLLEDQRIFLLGTVNDDNFEVMEYLLRETTKILSHEQQRSVLFLAVDRNNFKMVKLLLEEIENASSTTERCKFFMAENYKTDILTFAVEKNNTEIIKLLWNEAEKVLSPEERQEFITKLNLKENIFFVTSDS